MSEEKIPEESKLNRRRFLSAAAMTVAAAQSGALGSVGAEAGITLPSGGSAGKPDATTSFAPLKQRRSELTIRELIGSDNTGALSLPIL